MGLIFSLRLFLLAPLLCCFEIVLFPELFKYSLGDLNFLRALVTHSSIKTGVDPNHLFLVSLSLVFWLPVVLLIFIHLLWVLGQEHYTRNILRDACVSDLSLAKCFLANWMS